ncbi:MAG: nucleoside hydrolase [Candidatus Humimicrobiaceae bacterium]
MEQLIIDTDIGTYYDDAFAVLFAVKSPEIKVEAVTTVYGDTDLRARIACKILEIAGHPEIPVAAGVGNPISGEALMFGFEGTNILDGSTEIKKPEKTNAVNLIIEKVLNNPGKINIVTLGALTNIAIALLLEPSIAGKIKNLIMMGGVIVPVVDAKGITRSPIEEYNFNNDPTATQIVFNSIVKKTLIPIDVTLRVPLKQSQIETIKKIKAPVPDIVSKILDVWPEQERLIYLSVGIPTEFTGIWLHDPLTVGYVVDKSLVKISNLHVAAEFAPTFIPRDLLVRHDILRTIPKKKSPNMEVAVGVYSDRFTELFTNRIISK